MSGSPCPSGSAKGACPTEFCTLLGFLESQGSRKGQFLSWKKSMCGLATRLAHLMRTFIGDAFFGHLSGEWLARESMDSCDLY